MKKTWNLFSKTALMLFLSIFFCATQGAVVSVHAQSKTVTGTILDEEKLPLIGVSVSVKGTATGTITDIDGHYSINVPGSNSVLQFSFVGYMTQAITVGSQSTINFTMKEDLQNLEEVVVVGYGVQKKSHLTGSITKVKTDGLEDIPVSRVDQALQGRVAGVQIQNTTSEVGEAPIIRVRGMGSISAGSEPLVIIDGFPVDGGLGVVNASDIESIEVLKDAASAAIYGSRAAAGVIIITTKSGDIKKPKYTAKASFGTKDAYKLHPIMTAQEYVNMRVNENNLAGTKLSDQDFSFACINNNTNWQEEGLRTAHISNVEFSISGGTKEVKYYVSGSYLNDQGIMINSEYEKMSVRAKLDATLSKIVKVGVNLNPTYTTKEKPSTQFIDFYRSPSWLPVKHTEATAAITGAPIGSYAYGSQFNNKIYSGIDPQTNEPRTTKATSPFSSANHNPRMVMDTDHRYTDDYRLQSSGYMTISLMKGLEFKTSNGVNVRYSVAEAYREKDSKQDGITNRSAYANTLTTTLLTENTLNYLKKIGKHDFNALLGYSFQKTNYSTAGIVGLDFPTDYIHTINAATTIAQYEADSKGNLQTVTGTWKEEEGLASYYARLMYSYDDKYLLSASIRDDESSKFGDEKRHGVFPSVSLGWRISEEPFLKPASWINQLKLRASYGVTGNDKIVNYANTNVLGSSNYVLGSGNGSVVAGMSNISPTLANPALQWEQTDEYNYGIDFSVLDSRINLTAEYYYSITRKLLYQQPISSVSGHDYQWTNLGKVRNKGIEVELNAYPVKTKDFEWNAAFNISANQNKLLDLGGADYLPNTGEANEMYMAILGDPAIQFYGFKTIGVWKDQAEIDANPHHATDVPGGLKIWDADKSGSITDDDRVVLGNPFPDFTWGFTNTFKYAQFDLSVLFQGVQGIDVYNGDGRYNESRKWNENYVKNRWISPEHPGDGKTPYFTNGFNWMLTDYMIEDGSYIALRDITLGYTLPSKTARKIKLSNVRLYVSGQNLAMWWASDYRGINPEARMKTDNYSSPLIDGYQRGGFPVQRTISAGLNVTF